MKRLLIPLAAAVVLAGCGVSKQVVAAKDADLQSCREDLGGCAQELQSARAELERLRAELAGAPSPEDLAGSQQELEAARRDALALQRSEAELRENLAHQLQERTVEIDHLRGQLRVRVLEQLFFAPGRVDIAPKGKAVLDAIAASLGDSEGQLRVEGHTDEIPIGQQLKGKWFSNWELSAARAASVVRYLQYAHGIDPRRMTVVGHSAFHPVAPNDTAENRARNRRVEIVLNSAP